LTPLVKSGTSRFCRPPTMDKLIEREHAARNPLIGAPALAVKFFLTPLFVVAITGSVYVGFRSMLADDRTAQDYLAEIRNGGSSRRWPAAYHAPPPISAPNGAAANICA